MMVRATTTTTTTLLLLALTTAATVRAGVPGGWEPADVDTTSPTLLAALQGGDAAYASTVGATRVCVTKVTAVEQQVVSGMNYRFHIEGCSVATTGFAGPCAKAACPSPSRFVVRVYEQVWTNTLEVKAIKKEGEVKAVEKPEDVVAALKAAPLVDDKEKAQIDKWIAANDLNEFGDPKHTMYTGGTPLFDESTGMSIDRYDYIVNKHPDRPWAQVLQVMLAQTVGGAKTSVGFASIIASVGVLTLLFALVAGVKVRRSGHRFRYDSLANREL